MVNKQKMCRHTIVTSSLAGQKLNYVFVCCSLKYLLIQMEPLSEKIEKKAEIYLCQILATTPWRVAGDD